MSRSSGDKATDEDAMRAVGKASPFKPLPSPYFDDEYSFGYTFYDHPPWIMN